MNNIILNDNKCVKSKTELNLDNNTLCLSKIGILKYFPKNKINTSRYINFISKYEEYKKVIKKNLLHVEKDFLLEKKAIEQRAKKGGKNE